MTHDAPTSLSAPLVAAVIVTWNGRELVLACLESLTAVTYPPSRFRVIVVDNGSTDGAVAAIERRFPDVDVIALPRNEGYAAAVNVGLHRAAETNARYYWVFNNDVEVHAGALQVLIDVAEAHADIGVVGPVVYDMDDRDHVQHCGYLVSLWTGRMTRLRWGRDIFADRDQGVATVDSCFGCANLIRAACVNAVGGYDARFNVYFDETEFNERVRRAGYRVVVARDAQVWHAESATMNKFLAWKAYLLLRNLCLFEFKHAGPLRLMVFIPYFVCIHLPQFFLRGIAYALRARISKRYRRPATTA